MFIKGEQIRYALFIEGVRVPFRALSFMNQRGGRCQLNVDIPPHDTAREFVRGMHVMLFKSTNDHDFYLKFSGITVNMVYSKRTNERTVTITAEALTARWDRLYFSEVVSGSNCSAMNLVLGSPEELEVGPGITQKDVDVSTKNIFGAHALTASAYFESNPGGETMSANDPAPTGSIHRMFANQVVKEILGSGSNILEGVIRLIKRVYTQSNPYISHEATRVLIEDAMRYINFSSSTADNNLLSLMYQNVVDVPSEEQGVDLSKRAAQLNTSQSFQQVSALVSIIERILSGSPGFVNLMQIVQSILGILLHTMSIDPLRIKGQVLFHPDLIGLPPPRCNVIFPHQINTINYNPNQWNEVSRSLFFYPPYYGPVSGNPEINRSGQPTFTRLFVCSATDPTIGKLAAKLINGNLTSANAYISAEEALKGTAINIQHITSPYFNSPSAEAGWALSEYLHFIQKYGVRQCTVNGALIDDVSVGMPALIVDGGYSVHGIVESHAYSVTPDGKTLSTVQLTECRFLDVDAVPPLPLWMRTPELSSNQIGPQIYAKLFGCMSLIDPFSDKPYGSAATNEADALKQATNCLIEDYNAAQDKGKFADLYRARSQVSQEVAASTLGLTVFSQDDRGPVSYQGKVYNQLIIPETGVSADRQSIVQKYLAAYYGRSGVVLE